MQTDIQPPELTDAFSPPEPGHPVTPSPRQNRPTPRVLGILLRHVIAWPLVLMLLVTALVIGIEASRLLTHECGLFGSPKGCLYQDNLVRLLIVYLICSLACLGGLILLLRALFRPGQGRLVRAWGLGLGLILVASLSLPGLGSPRPPYRRLGPMGSIESVRTAFAIYATNASGHTFPSAIRSWGDLAMLVNANGGSIRPSEQDAGFVLRGYSPIDTEGDGIIENYTMSFRILGVREDVNGSLVFVSPQEVDRRRLRN